MAVPGTKPKENHRHRVKPTHEWTEVPDVRFTKAPKLPKTQPNGTPWSQWTLDWWKAVSTMPHCALWDEEDWRFAIETAVVAASFHAGNVKAATEMRNREKVMGTTMDFRRDLRIRYVEPKQEAPEGVTAIADYKRRLLGE